MISIITPVYNGIKFITKNIESVQKLSVPYEHIIVDGGSSDGTVELVEKYQHIKLVHQQEDLPGMYGAIHQGFTEAAYDIITWVNCDDEIIAENYTKAILIMKEKKIDFIYGNSKFYWQSDSKYTDHKAASCGKFFLKHGILPFVQPSSIYRKNLYLNTKLRFDIFKICGDIDLFMRMASIPGIKFYYYKKPLSIFLRYGESLGDRSHDLYLEEKSKLFSSPTIMDYILFKVVRILF